MLFVRDIATISTQLMPLLAKRSGKIADTNPIDSNVIGLLRAHLVFVAMDVGPAVFKCVPFVVYTAYMSDAIVSAEHGWLADGRTAARLSYLTG